MASATTRRSLRQRLRNFFSSTDSTSAKHATGRATTIPYKANGQAQQTLNTSNKPAETTLKQTTGASAPTGTSTDADPATAVPKAPLQTEAGPKTEAETANALPPSVPVATIAPPIAAADVVDDGFQSTPVTRNPYRIRAPFPHRKRLTKAQLARLREYKAKFEAGEAARDKIPNLLSLDPEYQLPDLPWLCGTWHVTHSTLPMWKSKRNVRISYTRLPGDRLDDVVSYQEVTHRAAAGSATAAEQISIKTKTVKGVDAPFAPGRAHGVWKWRGRGMLFFVTSKWEVLGWGGRVLTPEEVAASASAKPTIGAGVTAGTATGEPGNTLPAGSTSNQPQSQSQTQTSAQGQQVMEQWVVTYFAKTMFTPAGIDIYSRRAEGLSPATVQRLVEGLQKVDSDAIRLARIQPPSAKDKEQGMDLAGAGVDVQPSTDAAPGASTDPSKKPDKNAAATHEGYGDFSRLVSTLFEVERDAKTGGVLVVG